MGAHLKTFRISLILLVSWLSTPQSVRAQAPQPPKPPVFGADVAVVAVPVFVTDKNGKAVGGLTAADFEVEDGGRKVPIVAFQAIDVDAPVTVESEAGLSALPISVQAEGPRQFLLLLDLEFSPPAGTHRGRAAASSFIREQLAPGDLVAVAVWGRYGLRVLSNFTADHEKAALALEGKGAVNTPGLDPLGLAGGFGNLAPSGMRSDEQAAEIEAVQQQIMKEEYATRVAAFLEDVSDLVRKLGTLRGRKQLVLLSGGFRESAWNSEVSQGNRAESVPNVKRMQKIFEEAGRGDVVVHAVSLYGIPNSFDLSSRTGRSDSRTADGSVDLRTSVDLASGRSTLATFTKNTGGFFIQPTNDFGRALSEVDRVSRQSYVIGFEAAEPAPAGKARELKVRVRRSGLSVSHRTTYVAPATLTAEASGGRALEAAEAIAKGLTGGSLPLHLTTLPYRDALGQPVVHAVLDIGAQGFSNATADRPLSVEIYAYLMEGGRVLDSLAASTSVDLSRVGTAVRRSGLQILTAFPLPGNGASLRFFVRAGESGPTGSIQQNVTAPVFASGQPVLSTPLFNLPLAGRMALPFQPKDRPRIEIPFRLGGEPFIPEGGVVLKAGTTREVCVFVWPGRAEPARRFEVSAELTSPGETARAVQIDGAPRVVADKDGFDRYVLSIAVPETPTGSYALRLTFRDPASGLVTQSRAVVLIER